MAGFESQAKRAAAFIAEVESGDRKRALVALRGELARAITATNDGAELSSLTLRLQRVLEQIDQLGGADEGESDDLAAKRQAKLRAAAGA